MISCSMLEIYNEKMMDLFIFPQHNSSEPQELKLKEINDQIIIDGLVEVEVEDESEILELVRLGHKNRKVASTYNNDASSRSHTILFVYRRL
jgi:kinesin family protein 4/21/27